MGSDESLTLLLVVLLWRHCKRGRERVKKSYLNRKIYAALLYYTAKKEKVKSQTTKPSVALRRCVHGSFTDKYSETHWPRHTTVITESPTAVKPRPQTRCGDETRLFDFVWRRTLLSVGKLVKLSGVSLANQGATMESLQSLLATGLVLQTAVSRHRFETRYWTRFRLWGWTHVQCFLAGWDLFCLFIYFLISRLKYYPVFVWSFSSWRRKSIFIHFWRARRHRTLWAERFDKWR